jgi:hypothetical protein
VREKSNEEHGRGRKEPLRSGPPFERNLFTG